MASDDAERVAKLLEHPRTLRLNFSAGLVDVRPQMFLDVAAALRAGSVTVMRTLQAAGRGGAVGMYVHRANAIVIGKMGTIAAPGTDEAELLVHEAVHAWCDGHRVGSRRLLEEAAASIANTAYVYMSWTEEQIDAALDAASKPTVGVFELDYLRKMAAVVRKHSLHRGKRAEVSAHDCVAIAEALRRLPAVYSSYDHSSMMPSDGWGCGLACRSSRAAMALLS